MNYENAMKVETEDDADIIFGMLVSNCMRETGDTREECEALQRKNLGYYAGYYDKQTRTKVEKWYNAVHPYLGAADLDLTPEEIFQIGFELGKKKESQT